jgi:hypothetical protein
MITCSSILQVSGLGVLSRALQDVQNQRRKAKRERLKDEFYSGELVAKRRGGPIPR